MTDSNAIQRDIDRIEKRIRGRVLRNKADRHEIVKLRGVVGKCVKVARIYSTVEFSNGECWQIEHDNVRASRRILQ